MRRESRQREKIFVFQSPSWIFLKKRGRIVKPAALVLFDSRCMPLASFVPSQASQRSSKRARGFGMNDKAWAKRARVRRPPRLRGGRPLVSRASSGKYRWPPGVRCHRTLSPLAAFSLPNALQVSGPMNRYFRRVRQLSLTAPPPPRADRSLCGHLACLPGAWVRHRQLPCFKTARFRLDLDQLGWSVWRALGDLDLSVFWPLGYLPRPPRPRGVSKA